MNKLLDTSSLKLGRKLQQSVVVFEKDFANPIAEKEHMGRGSVMSALK